MSRKKERERGECIYCATPWVIFGEMVVESIGEEELSLFVECGEGGQPCSVYVERWGGVLLC
eukprot:scaffold8112_cov136-Isochrysis_galbana.AAC.7